MKQAILPQWAHWIAMDEDGSWWCFEAEPHQYSHGWYENEVGRYQKVKPGIDAPDSWQNSLMSIPKN